MCACVVQQQDSAVPAAQMAVQIRPARSTPSEVKNLTVRAVAPGVIRHLIIEHHYLHSMPMACWRCFAIYAGADLKGAAVFTAGPRNGFRVLLGANPQQVAVLARLWLADDLPKNAESRVAAARTAWLDSQYKNWSKRNLIPLFRIDNQRSEAAWHGWAHDQYRLSVDTLKSISHDFVTLLTGKASWSFDETEYRYCLHRFVFASRKSGKKPAIFCFDQVSAVLTAIDDRGRVEVLTALAHAISQQGEWINFVKPIIERAWPRQLKYRSEETSRAFAYLLTEAGSDFPDAVRMITPFMIPIPHLEATIYRILHETDDSKIDLAKSYPDAILSLLGVLVADDRPSIPHDLPRVLGIIAESQPALRQSRIWRRLHDLSG